MNRYNLLILLCNGIALALTGRLHFPREKVDKKMVLEGEQWVVFREAVVDPGKGSPQKPGAIFRPRFHIACMSVNQNIVFSLLPMCFLMGMPGFRSKLWMYNPETEDFSGYYLWDTIEDAEKYSNSIAGRFMTNRSVPGSISFRILPNE